MVKNRSLPRTDDIWIHFKGNEYKIITIAEHTETKEKFVVYRALYGTYKEYVRPLDMFMSEVDHEKYPDVKQKYRFELLTCGLELICSRYKNECETCRQPIFGLEREI